MDVQFVASVSPILADEQPATRPACAEPPSERRAETDLACLSKAP